MPKKQNKTNLQLFFFFCLDIISYNMTNQNTENIEDEVNCKSEEVFESSITNSYPLVAIDTSSKIYESSSKVKHSSDLSGSKECKIN